VLCRWVFDNDEVARCVAAAEAAGETAGAAADGDAAAAAAAAATAAASSGAPEQAKKSEEELLHALDDVCVTLEQGWWSYKWCHRKEIRQFHAEPNGQVAHDWSLGKFDAGGKKFRVDPTAGSSKSKSGGAAQTFYSHFFVGGQKCDETKSQRQTEVQFFCCDDDKGTYIRSIQEPGVCRYTLKVCVAELCSSESANAYSQLYPPCGTPGCAKRHSRLKLEPKQRDAACAQCAARQRRRAASSAPAAKAALAKCKAAAAERGEGDDAEARLYGLLWNNLVSEEAEDLRWTDSAAVTTSIGR
jgi:hypothetical protein